MIAKPEIRRAVQQLVAGLSPEVLHKAGLAAARKLVSSDFFARSGRVALFNSLPSEIDTTPLIEVCFAHGKSVFLPVTLPGRGMEMRRVYSLDDSRALPQVPPFGIREPRNAYNGAGRETLRVADEPSDSDVLVVVPGVAFDGKGGRLGHGGGYYDRFLARLLQSSAPEPSASAIAAHAAARVQLVGVCVPQQLVETVPMTETDIPIPHLIIGSPDS